jgi:hypothetical protein
MREHKVREQLRLDGENPGASSSVVHRPGTAAHHRFSCT